MLNGFVIVDKPLGWTSRRVVTEVSKLFRQRRAGHMGTLDPAASGVLPVALGNSCRLMQFTDEWHKTYEAWIRFGVASESGDTQGTKRHYQAMPDLDPQQVKDALRTMQGVQLQYPPVFSAVHVRGERAYERARRGEVVSLPLRHVVVFQATLLTFEAGMYPRALVRFEVSSGTYVRSLATSLGEKLGGLAMLYALRRTQAGPFTQEEAVSLELLRALTSQERMHYLQRPWKAVSHLSVQTLSLQERRQVEHGGSFRGSPAAPGTLCRVMDGEELLAIYRRQTCDWQPVAVFR